MSLSSPSFQSPTKLSQSSNTDLQHPIVPVFRPTYDEFKNFSNYIETIEAQNTHRIGLAKIIPPKEWVARESGYNNIQSMDVKSPIKQEVHGKDGIYEIYNIQQKTLNLTEFEKLSNNDRYRAPLDDYQSLERKYWKNLTYVAPVYGADVSGTLYDSKQSYWNLNCLGTILDDLELEYGTKIQGVNTSYLYFGMWKATFAWHTEDMDLYSINYLHYGAPKQWYVIPPSYGKKFERLASTYFTNLSRQCPAFLRHKMTLISPSILQYNSIPYSKITQHPNEFIITFPYAYHSGFNYGYNCAESTNFAMKRWLEYGKHASACSCRHDMVSIGMDIFVKKYQPEIYEQWLLGNDHTPHPESDHNSTRKRMSTPSSVSKKRLPFTNKLILKSATRTMSGTTILPINDEITTRYQHQQTVSNERYLKIFTCLSKYDKQQQFDYSLATKINSLYSVPLLRSALSRSKSKLKTQNNTLLSLTSNIVEKYQSKLEYDLFSSIKPLWLFNGLKQAGKYREQILCELWQFNNVKYDFDKEKSFNQWLSLKAPHCSICQLFTMNKDNESDIEQEQEFLVNDVVFHLFNKQVPTTSASPKLLILTQCQKCKIVVHQTCYRNICMLNNNSTNLSDEETNNQQQWLCQRCKQQTNEISTTTLQRINEGCSLCLLSGGALILNTKEANEHKWAHIVCLIYHKSFQSSPVLTNEISSTIVTSSSSSTSTTTTAAVIQKKNQCHYCWSFCPLDKRRLPTTIVICDYPNCFNQYHVTCGLISGCTFDIGNWPKLLHTYCHLHSKNQMKYVSNFRHKKKKKKGKLNNNESEMEIDDDDWNGTTTDNDQDQIVVGTTILLKPYRNQTTEHLEGKLISIDPVVHYAVDFFDGSFSRDMLREDLLLPSPNDMPLLGTNINVRWTDDQIYPCTYVGSKQVLFYTILFDNGETKKIRRHEFRIKNSNKKKRDEQHSVHRQSISTAKRKRKRKILLLSSSSSSSNSSLSESPPPTRHSKSSSSTYTPSDESLFSLSSEKSRSPSPVKRRTKTARRLKQKRP
ncbi:unnamed protein product [Didymodactylos carnosus]|uniref:[Histone H3]-trimethyl-L-lysine(9) demethylase n=1 Tax=Didymodactylos carnosus TaxID=1234261 RepID=A0A813P7D5_9BILA|nr:unnamed protein product [Didymodactylos carnosus]CAF0750074.1 unnamed protein product [Didymodactylos carnosus]CAF3505318.1 unnamed protein product [Didymodactylos carnosus]CAF3529442.1 unnamed protein product [Didymodactylos carnosus]